MPDANRKNRAGTLPPQPTLKYQAEISGLPDCPPSHFKPKMETIFRWVYDDIKDERNFKPIAKLQPNRRFPRPEQCCISHGLSVYISLDAAKAAYQGVIKNRPAAASNFGTAVAEGTVFPSDGVIGPVNGDGHRTFFEFADVFLAEKFVIVGSLL